MGLIPRKWLPACLSLVLAGQALASPDIASFGRPALRVFTDRDGLPQNSIENILTDHQGYLWIATQDGMARYNGRAWEHVLLPNRKDSQWVRGALVARDGSLWLGRQLNGVCRLKDGQWTSYDTGQGLPKGPVMGFLERADGSFLAATGAGVFSLQGGRWIPLAPAEPRMNCQVNQLLEGDDGAGQPVLWAATERGLGLCRNGRWTWTGLREGLPADSVLSLCQPQADRHSERIWAGTALGPARFDGHAWRALGPGDGVPRNLVNRIVEAPDRQGRSILWLGTGAGLVRWDQGQARTYSVGSGFPNQIVRSLLVSTSPEGIQTVWVGTFGGLIRMSSGMWVTLDTHSGLSDNVCFHLEELRDPDGWLLSTLGGGLARFQDGRWQDFGASGFAARQVFTTCATHTAAGPVIWAGTMGDGLQRWQAGRWSRQGQDQGPDHGIADSWIYSLREVTESDGRSVLWVGTRSGIARLDRGRWTEYLEADGVPKAGIMAFAETRVGGQLQIWAASRGGGVLRLDGQRWVAATLEDGLPNLWVMDLKAHTSASGEHQLWAATFSGLARLDLDRPGTRWQALTRDQLPALPGDVFYQIQFDHQGRLYAFSLAGVARLTPTGTDPATWPVHLFTTGDGLPSNGCSQGSTLVDRRGRVWTGTVAGAAMLDPEDQIEDHTAKPLVMEKILVGGQPRPVDQPLKLSWRGAELEFQYALLSYYRESDTQFRTQLVGLESQPSAWSSDPKRTYPTLPAGSYTFRVWGRDYNGNLSGPVQCGFTIPVPPWRSGWALAGYLLVLGATLRGLVRLRLRALQARNQELEARVKERTRELEIMDDIVQAMNRQTDLASLFRELLDKGLLLFPKADRIVLLLRSDDRASFRAEAARSSRPGEEAVLTRIVLPQDQAIARYTLQGHELDEGVFLIQDFDQLPGPDLDLPVPAAMLAMTLVAGTGLEGFLVLDHLGDRDGFSHSDELKLARFRAHAVSAVGKARSLAKLEQANQALKEASMVDPMTGLKNRRFLDVSMAEELARVSRQRRGVQGVDRSRRESNVDLLFYMVDLDHFKMVNDTYGHAAGDAVLRQASDAIKATCRESDIVVRWGGEEFLVMARNSDRSFGQVLAQNLRQAIAGHPFELGHGETIHKTCSIGYSAFPVLPGQPDLISWEAAVELADQCLYAAKCTGRNAWVGVRAVDGPGPRQADFLDDLPAAIKDGTVEIQHSFPPGTALEWPTA